MHGVLASKDFLAGILYMVFGLLGLWLGRDLESGTAEAMGAGFFPRLVCALLIAIGALLAALSVMRTGETLERGKWRPTVLARLADGNIRAIPLALLCALLIAINVAIFVVGLRIAIPPWPAAL